MSHAEKYSRCEPEVWIEYMRADLNNDTFARRSFATVIVQEGLIPDGTVIRSGFDTKTGECIWEYLM